MHSSTSSSSLRSYQPPDEDRPKDLRAPALPTTSVSPRRIAILIACIAASVLLLEAGTRWAFSRVSRIERRITHEHAEAISIRPLNGTRSVLLMGNSLLLQGIDHDLLRRSLPSSLRAHRFVIESTHLLDWKFGLRRLFEDGARPDVIVVCVGETNILPTEIRGDYSAYYLFRTADLREIADTIAYDNTRLGSLYLARYSLFFAGRASLRNFLLNRVDHSYGNLLHTLVTVGDKPTPPVLIEAAAVERLADMRREAEGHGARLLLLVPPGFSPAYEPAIAMGAARAGVTVIAPVRQSAWGNEMFSDGFHLNERGEREFTRLAAPQIVTAALASGLTAAVISAK
jgi:hypothetical protein